MDRNNLVNMTQEEKELLLKDLCVRLPYGVNAITKTHKGEKVGKIISVSTKNNIILGELYDGKEYFWLDYGSFKPYLRPMSSMTEEERSEFDEYTFEIISFFGQAVEAGQLTDWLNSKHFDYRGLIPMGLALEAPEGMYNMK